MTAVSSFSGTPDVPGYEIAKVNHELIDSTGETQSSIADWVDRARYQKSLRKTGTAEGIRFFVHWKAPQEKRPITVVVEARGYDAGTGEEVVEVLRQIYEDVSNAPSWTLLDLKGDTYKKFGKMMAWRVSLVQGGKTLASRVSFQWDTPLPVQS